MNVAVNAIVIDVHLPAGVAGPEPLDFDVRCFLVPHSHGLALVDTGTPGSGARIQMQLERIGAAWTDITDVILTHHHPDHSGGLAEVATPAGKPSVWAGAPDLPFIPFSGTINALSEGMRVRTIRVLETPGHTPGHRTLVDDAASVVFAGDVVGSMQGKLTRGPAAFTTNPEQAEQSLRRVAGLSFDRLLLSHGDEVNDPFAALRELVAPTFGSGSPSHGSP